ncbi:hypothetical protein EB810_07085 [Altererythrobacter sp. FM1]|uniref:hypothetical protein n=1 Tax=Tsuneonella flava TaxID=2055955 RepID=UPI000C810809|nr:hypothetical protein [Tsuneonella flava]ROT94908.1 hypothetical protein EB810_07085 [Altererythrobacter sp. FM1]
MIRPTRLTFRSSIAVACLVVAGCSAPRIVPTPAPKPVEQAPAPTPAPAPAPKFENWMDAPATPGDWSYRSLSNGGLAQFGEKGAAPVMWMQCDRGARTVTIYRAGAAAGSLPVRIRTETADRVFSGSPVNAGGRGAIATALPAASPFLDAIAISKGRFAIETAGMAPLYIPSWPEITRVIEDCR